MPNLPKLHIDQTADPIARKNLENMREFFKTQTPLLGFKFFEIEFNRAVTEEKHPHNLGFQPKDVILTSIIGVAGVTFHYDQFDTTNLILTVTGPCTVRFFVGTFQAGPK